MAYFMHKNRLVTRAISLRPNKWTPKWSIVRQITTTRLTLSTSSSSSTTTQTTQGHQQQQNTGGSSGGHAGGGDSSGSNGGNSSSKGKLLSFKRKWSWKAGAGWTVLSVLDWWLLAAGGWLTWKGVFLRWTPLGLCAIAAMQWHLHNKELEKKGLPRTASQWQTNVYCSLPLRTMSRCWGWLADCSVPTPLRPALYGLYATTFGVNINEAASSDFKNYRSLGEFFTRSLKEDVRIIDSSCLVSPCDGTVLHFGTTTNSQIEQVKGVSYNIETFLGPATWINANNDECLNINYIDCIKKRKDTILYQCIIYLAPGDYHRFHSPTTWAPSIRRHFSGELLSVSPKIAQWMPGLFCLNERALYIGNWDHGFFSFTAVGATNVGSVQIYMDEELKTNKWMGWKIGKHKGTEYEELPLLKGSQLGKGELVGQFNMGSTIVLIFEAPKEFRFNIKPGQTIKMGESIGCVTVKDDTNVPK